VLCVAPQSWVLMTAPCGQCAAGSQRSCHCHQTRWLASCRCGLKCCGCRRLTWRPQSW
jgi:hypothetical protein